MYALKRIPRGGAAVAGLLLWSGMAFGQGAGSHTLGGFAGFTDRYDTDLTLGAEYEYRLQRPWSAGAIIEYTPDVLAGSDFTVLMGTAHYRLPGTPRLKLTGGAGIEMRERFADDIRFRLGVGYDLIEGPITVTPRIAFDLGGGEESIVLGVSVLFGL